MFNLLCFFPLEYRIHIALQASWNSKHCSIDNWEKENKCYKLLKYFKKISGNIQFVQSMKQIISLLTDQLFWNRASANVHIWHVYRPSFFESHLKKLRQLTYISVLVLGMQRFDVCVCVYVLQMTTKISLVNIHHHI